MASGNQKKKVEIDSDGIKEMLKSLEVEGYLLEVAQEIRQDAEDATGDEFFAEPWYGRRTRVIVNIGSLNERGNFKEAETGDIARIANKPRGE